MTALAARLERALPNAEQVRDTLRESRDESVRRRRAVIGLSLIGMTAMGAVSLLQAGIVKHLPDPPLDRFNSDEANLSNVAYKAGTPDGTLALASLAANLPIAAFGGADRGERRPWIALIAAAKAAIDAAGAGAYFYRMASKQDPWCGYCITGALVNFSVLALTLPEAKQALGR